MFRSRAHDLHETRRHSAHRSPRGRRPGEAEQSETRGGPFAERPSDRSRCPGFNLVEENGDRTSRGKADGDAGESPETIVAVIPSRADGEGLSQAPNFKPQAPEKFQTSNSLERRAVRLELGA